MPTKDEAYQQYEESLALISKKSHEDMGTARCILRGQLSILREAHHEELKAIRAIEQKTKRSKKNV